VQYELLKREKFTNYQRPLGTELLQAGLITSLFTYVADCDAILLSVLYFWLRWRRK